MPQPGAPNGPGAATAIASPPPAQTTPPLLPTDPPPPAGAKRWFFRLQIDADAKGKARERLVGYVALSERTVTRPGKGKAGKPVDVKITALRLEEGGRLLSETDLERLEIPAIPIEPVSPHQTLVQRTIDGQTAIWWRVGRLAQTDTEVDALLAEAPDFLPLQKAGKKPKDPPLDVAVHFKSKFGTEPTTCTSFIHPARESGDTYDIERCFAPALGTLAYTKLISVWGSYELELLNTPH